MTGSLLTLIGILSLLVVTIVLNHNRPESKENRALLPMAIGFGVFLGLAFTMAIGAKSFLVFVACAVGGAAILALIYSTTKTE